MYLKDTDTRYIYISGLIILTCIFFMFYIILYIIINLLTIFIIITNTPKRRQGRKNTKYEKVRLKGLTKPQRYQPMEDEKEEIEKEKKRNKSTKKSTINRRLETIQIDTTKNRNIPNMSYVTHLEQKTLYTGQFYNEGTPEHYHTLELFVV